MKEVIVTLDDGQQVVVKKLPLGKYSEVFLALQELPKLLGNIDELSTEEFMARLPAIIGESLPEVAKVLSVATEVPEKQINEELGLAEVIDLLVAVIEVNNVERLVKSVKKLMARQPKKIPSTGSPEPSMPSPANTDGPSETS